jgi:hypothetical protein
MRSHRSGLPAAAACALALALAGCDVSLANFFVYFPDRGHEGIPAQLGLPAEDIWFVAEDGVRLHGWFVPAPGAAEVTLLWFHGNAGNISHRLDHLRRLRDRLTVHICIVDYRGYGRSEGRPSEAGLYRDARAALAGVRRDPRVRPDRIVYFGQSLGTAVAVELAIHETPLGLVLESPFTSLRAMGRVVYPWLPVNLLVGNQFDSLSRIPQARAPLLILHGDRDEVVPFAQGRQLFEAAAGPKFFHAIRGAGHNDTYLVGGPPYLDAWHAFLKRLDSPVNQL